MTYKIPATPRASQIEYAIRDVVVPASKLESQGIDILKLNIGDPLAYPGLPTPTHMIDAYQKAIIDQKNGYSPAYGIESLRNAIRKTVREMDFKDKELFRYSNPIMCSTLGSFFRF